MGKWGKDRILAEAERDASAIKDEANKEADKIINDAKETFNNMISEHEITKKQMNLQKILFLKQKKMLGF